MSQIFISHSSIDNAQAIAVKNWLLDNGWNDIFLDLDPQHGIHAGAEWEKTLETELTNTQAMIFLISDNWLTSEWCLRELETAYQLNQTQQNNHDKKPFFPLLLKDVTEQELPQELKKWQAYHLEKGSNYYQYEITLEDNSLHTVAFSGRSLQALKNGLRKANIQPTDVFAWPPSNEPNRSPYRGLSPLQAEDAGIFFGREGAINDLMEILYRLQKKSEPRFIAIQGASGSGKSSFMRAGILPRLRRDERNFVVLPIVRPENAVISDSNGLINAIDNACKTYQLPDNLTLSQNNLEQDIATLEQILTSIAQAHQQQVETDSLPTLILAIDQAEELFTSASSESTTFLDYLYNLCHSLNIMVICTIRSDSYTSLQTHSSLGDIQQRTFPLPQITSGAYKQIIEAPVELLAYSEQPLYIEPQLTEQLLKDLEKDKSKDSLPLLAFTLERLYSDYGDDRKLTLKEYSEGLGGLSGAVGKAVDRALDDIEQDPKTPNDREACLKLFRRGLIPWLAGIDPNTKEPFRRVANYDEIPAEARPLMDYLIEYRLLVKDRDNQGNITIEPIHESILRQWKQVGEWLKEDMPYLSAWETLNTAVGEWLANNRHEDWLSHHSTKLKEAEKLLQRADFAESLKEPHHSYLSACRQAEEEQKEAELQQQKKIVFRTRIGLAVAVVLLVIAGVLGFLAREKTIEAEKGLVEANHNYALALNEKAMQAEEEGNIEYAKLYALHALKNAKEGKLPNKAENILLNYGEKSNKIWEKSITFHHNAKYVDKIAISPNGKTILSLSNDETETKINLWDIETGNIIKSFQKPKRSIKKIAFSPNGEKFAIQTSDKREVYLYNIHNNARKMFEHQDDFTFSNKSQLIVFSNDNNYIKKRNTDVSNSEISIEIPKEKKVLIETVSQDGNVIVSNSRTNYDRIIVSNLSNNTHRTFEFPSISYRSVTLSSDNRILAIGAERRLFGNQTYEVILIDLTQQKDNIKIIQYSNSIEDVALSPNTNLLAVASSSNSSLLNTKTGNIVKTLIKNSSFIQDVEFSKNGKILVSASWNKKIKLWNVETGKSLKSLHNLLYIPNKINISENGRNLLSIGEYHISLIDLITGKNLKTAQTECYQTVSPNNKMLVYQSSDDYYVNVWDINNNKIINRFLPPPLSKSSCGYDFIFSKDSKKVALYSNYSNSNIYVWSLENNQIIKLKHRNIKYFSSVRLSSNGSFLIATKFNTITKKTDILLWDLETGEELTVFSTDEHISNINFSHNNELLAFGVGKTILIWSVDKKTLVQELNYAEKIHKIDFSANNENLIISLGSGYSNTGDSVIIQNIKDKTIYNSQQDYSSFNTSKDGVFVAIYDHFHKGKIIIWNTFNGETIRTINDLPVIYDARFSNNNLLYFIADGKLKIFDIKQNKVINSFLQKHDVNTKLVSFSSDDRVLANFDGRKINLWNIYDKKEKIKKLISDNIFSISNDGKKMFKLNYDKIQIIDNVSRKKLRDINLHLNGEVLMISKNNNTIITSQDEGTISSYKKYILYIDTQTNNIINKIPFSNDRFDLSSHSIFDCAKLSPNENMLAVNVKGDIKLFYLKKQKEYTLPSNHSMRCAFAFSPKSDKLAFQSSSVNEIAIIDINSKKILKKLKGHTDYITNMIFLPNDKELISSSKDGTIRLWNIDNGKTIKIFKLDQNNYTEIIRFLEAKNLLVSFNNDGSIYLWDLKMQKIVAKKNPLEFSNSSNDKIVFDSYNNLLLSSPLGFRNALVDAPIVTSMLDLDSIQSLNSNHENLINNFNNTSKLNLKGLNISSILPKPNLYGQKLTKPIYPTTHPFHWLPLAEKGDSNAMLQLGIIEHRDSHWQKAKEWYEKALQAGNKDAKERLRILQLTKDYEEKQAQTQKE